MSGVWRKCSSCRNPIALGSPYFTCSVSTCNSKRMGLFFCSVSCWEAHLPSMRHREAWAVEAMAPRTGASQPATSEKPPEPARQPHSAPSRKVVASATGRRKSAAAPTEILIIASRLKAFVRATCGMNTSDGVLDPLSDHLRRLMFQAIDNAEADGRKTLLARDFTFLRK